MVSVYLAQHSKDKDLRQRVQRALAYDAASLSKSNVHIVESKSAISLINMMMNISKDIDVKNVSELIMSSLNDIRFCGIARAVRNTTTDDGKQVNKNDFFSVYEGKIIFSGRSIENVITKSIEKFINGESLVTLYKGIPAKKQKSLIAKLTKIFPNLDFEEYYSGQYQYYYYITFE